MLLQETNFFHWRDVNQLKIKFNIACFFSYAPSLSNGVGILIFNQQLLNGSFCMFDPTGRYLSFDFYFQNLKYRIVIVYAPVFLRSHPLFFVPWSPCFCAPTLA